MVRELVDSRPSARQRRRRRGHRGDLLAGRELGGGVEALADRRRLVLGRPDDDSTRLRSGPPPSAATSAAGGTSAATRSGVARNSRRRARQLRQVRMCGRRIASSSALASPSASADSSGS